jgi:hypothetical protein
VIYVTPVEALVANDSILNKVPLELDRRQSFLIEGILLCAHSIDMSMSSIIEELLFISTHEMREHSHHLLFREAWNLIDVTYRLATLLQKMATNQGNTPKQGGDLEYILQTKPFRNTLQHLDERIDDYILPKNAPVWGHLSWAIPRKENTLRVFVLTIGAPREGFNISISPACKPSRLPVDHITIEAIQRNANEPVAIIDLSELHRRTKRIMDRLEVSVGKLLAQIASRGTKRRWALLSVDYTPDDPTNSILVL